MTAVVLVGILTMAGCTRFDREGSIDEFVDGGMSRSMATCVVDGIVDELGEDRAMSDDEPTAEEIEVIQTISLDCAAAE